MAKIIFLILISLLNYENVSSQQLLSPIVELTRGKVQGTIKMTPEGREFFAYQGIPFGKNPTGPLRFKAPEPADPWNGVLMTTFDPPPCLQKAKNLTTSTFGTEDCLQLNVYTPKLASNSSNPSLPVQVFIHGGSFYMGGIEYDEYNPERYMNLDMVAVLIKYRLGALGFLSTDDAAASGNFGLLDQNLALQWVRDNIAAFGGNPNDVTLVGQSAGSASVMFQYQSPMSAGLFHRAIAESGSSLCPWAVIDEPQKYAQQMGSYFNCSSATTTDLIECLREAKAEEIVAHTYDLMLKNLALIFVPNVETSSSGAFLTEDPLSAFQNGSFNQVPLQLGFTRDEGIIAYEYIFWMFDNITDITFDVIMPVILDLLTDYDTNLVNVSYAIKDEYYTEVDLENQTAVNIATIDVISDMFMKSWVTGTAAVISSHAVPVYLYTYDYVSSSSESNFTGEPDVRHHDELQYLWWTNITSEKDSEFQTRFFPLWSNFIIQGDHGTPSPSDDEWLATPSGQYNYFRIQEQMTMEGNYNTERMNFWWNTVPAIVYG